MHSINGSSFAPLGASMHKSDLGRRVAKLEVPEDVCVSVVVDNLDVLDHMRAVDAANVDLEGSITNLTNRV